MVYLVVFSVLLKAVLFLAQRIHEKRQKLAEHKIVMCCYEMLRKAVEKVHLHVHVHVHWIAALAIMTPMC